MKNVFLLFMRKLSGIDSCLNTNLAALWEITDNLHFHKLGITLNKIFLLSWHH